MTRLLADEHVSSAGGGVPPSRSEVSPRHISGWVSGANLSAKDTALLMTLREHRLVLVSFDRASLLLYAGTLPREGLGHSGVILFRRGRGAATAFELAYWKRSGGRHDTGMVGPD